MMSKAERSGEMKLEFTSDELFEIEKRFDELAELSREGFAQQMDATKLAKGEYTEAYRAGWFKEHLDFFNLCRTISAKCASARREAKK